ncbi:2,3,4,5-tetrahydropyridine-2,6-dicarboxylate N-succinyltransferase [Candidatus Vidania fulgoroideae]|nr:2,3,4,5-tetrahydropyridine-2,6-dicarboxylate N-succinyltransferase [Candidatus Vidania fulgoroideae]
MNKLKKKINKKWKKKNNKNVISLTKKIISLLENNKIKIVEKKNNKWKINIWIKKAIILHIKNKKSKVFRLKHKSYFDKFSNLFNKKYKKFSKKKIRISDGSVIREGVYIGKNTIIMPSFINIGSNIGKNSMVDTWSTIGSCAKIGNGVHISGGCGIGGVLEPIQNNPVIIENNCFIGARSEIVEGIIVREKSVISMGVFISKSTKIFDRTRNVFINNGIIPKKSVVVSGTIPYKNYSLYSAIIVKYRDKKTEKKIIMNNKLRK